jgi:hypothetical protein
MAITRSPALATAGRIFVGLIATAGAAFHALLWLFVAGFQCDESCDGGSWQTTPGAWQWTAMGALGFASFVLTLALAIAFAVRSSPRWLTLGLAAAAAVTAIAPWVINAT